MLRLLLLLISLFAATGVQANISVQSSLKVYQQSGLNKPQLTQRDILPLIEQLKSNANFNVSKIGESYLGKDIFRIDVGRGPIKIMMWTQMHGDEPTATAAVFDLINRINAEPKWFNNWAGKISLHIIPMLNPDGAEHYKRQNAQDMDINRDAKRLQTPEGRLLLAQANVLKPDFAFNLHDQNRFYSAGHSTNTATISLLAPAYNHSKDINDSRQKAMQLAGVLKLVVDRIIPGHLGRYDDTYSERAFGDKFSSLGVSTILIESGAYPGDPNRQVARQVNVEMLSAAINSIVSNSYMRIDLKPYHDIPKNRRNHFKDLIIEGVSVEDNQHSYITDMAINLGLPIKQKANIIEVGDLSPFSGFFTFDAKNWHYRPAKSYLLKAPMELNTADYLKLLKQGYGYFLGSARQLTNNTHYPIFVNKSADIFNQPLRNQPAVFFLKHDDGREIAVINGILIDLQDGRMLNSFST